MNWPKKPVLLFDGDCAFCRIWIDRWRQITGDAITYRTASEGARDYPQVPPGTYQKSVVLIESDGSFSTGAAAVLSALGAGGSVRFLRRLYQKFPSFAGIAEGSYAFIAGHRDESYLLTRALWGKSAVTPGFAHTQWMFLRGMGLIYFIAFYSLSVQVVGLVGANGISPAELFFEAVHTQIGNRGLLYYPSIAWLNPSDNLLRGLCYAGMTISVFYVAGVLPRISAVLLWVLYFSLFTAGQMFLSFQWDILLLEAGFLTIFLSPGGLFGFAPTGGEPRRLWRWLLWLLVFRLMFMSGVVKLTSGDSSWWNLTALSTHFETQCIPTPIAWYAHQLPLWFTRFSVFMMFVIEIGAPFLIFTPRRLRHLGASMLIFLQLLIILTGNYTFFNWLSILLCFALFDDALTGRLLPSFGGRRKPIFPTRLPQFRVPGYGRAAMVFFILMAVLNFLQISEAVVPGAFFPTTASSITRVASQYHIVNDYGLFRVMTKKRPEIIVEGSEDGLEWKAYEFRYKPGNASRPPPWVAPHQPRLDWQMWFAALGGHTTNRWFVNFCVRILEGSPEVLALLESDPFNGRPPRFVRALLYEYRFTTQDERAVTGDTWTRVLNSVYLPAISLWD